MDIASLYERVAAQRSDIQEHLGTFVSLALQAEKVIELGTRGGVSTVAWLYGLEDHGHLWSVDISPPPKLTFAHWTFIQGDDCSREVLDQLPADVDVVFVDTSHAYEHTLRELDLYVPRVKPGGRVLLHDTELESPDGLVDEPPFPVKKAVEEFCAAHGLTWTNSPNCWGLGEVVV